MAGDPDQAESGDDREADRDSVRLDSWDQDDQREAEEIQEVRERKVCPGPEFDPLGPDDGFEIDRHADEEQAEQRRGRRTDGDVEVVPGIEGRRESRRIHAA